MGHEARFPVDLKDGKYGGKWIEFNVEIVVDGETITGRCDVGIPKNDGFRFCVVTVTNGRATVTHAL